MPLPRISFVVAIAGAGFALILALAGTQALAGAPEPWQMTFQPAATPVMERIVEFNYLLMIVIGGIAVAIFALLGYTLVRFDARRNPVPTKTTHNTVIEVIWTVVPIMILAVIAVPSFRLLYFADKAPDAEMTLKAIGHQWSWSYEYPDQGGLAFDARMIETDKLKAGQLKLLETDNVVVLPVNTVIRLLVTADDVIHSWAVPAFGVKLDAVPGRVNETWMKITRPGTYYGQCSELCGILHGYMPIKIEAVSRAAFDRWVAGQKKNAGRATGTAAIHLAGRAAPLKPAE